MILVPFLEYPSNFWKRVGTTRSALCTSRASLPKPLAMATIAPADAIIYLHMCHSRNITAKLGVPFRKNNSKSVRSRRGAICRLFRGNYRASLFFRFAGLPPTNEWLGTMNRSLSCREHRDIAQHHAPERRAWVVIKSVLFVVSFTNCILGFHHGTDLIFSRCSDNTTRGHGQMEK